MASRCRSHEIKERCGVAGSRTCAIETADDEPVFKEGSIGQAAKELSII